MLGDLKRERNLRCINPTMTTPLDRGLNPWEEGTWICLAVRWKPSPRSSWSWQGGKLTWPTPAGPRSSGLVDKSISDMEWDMSKLMARDSAYERLGTTVLNVAVALSISWNHIGIFGAHAHPEEEWGLLSI